MQLIDGKPVFSATDLVGFLACPHLTNLDRAAVMGLARRPVGEDPEILLIAKRGLEHEHRYLDGLRAEGLQVTEIERDGSIADQGDQLRAAAAETEAAMRASAEVIYQATFFDGTWRGHADFLRRIETPSALGPWSYEVADTKLARSAKAGALLQLCVYNDLLDRVQDLLPTWMEVALGGSARQVQRFRLADSMAYYRRVKRRFLEAMGVGPAEWPVTATYPEPVAHCGVCKWAPVCGAQRRADDHLSLVANITSRQRRGLVSRGVDTVVALAELSPPVRPPIEGASPSVLVRIHEQARLQVEGRRAGGVLYEALEPEAERGLALLPAPSPGDLFFDIEGDPYVEEGGADGLDYLFGVIEPGAPTGAADAEADDGAAEAEPRFHAFWGTDRAAEKVAFEELIDLFMDRLQRDPDLHIYHYASYEPSHVKTLMGRHATREDEVDALLRGGVFVDLFTVVRQGVRVSQESYSIKKLEPLYDLERKVSLKDAGSSILQFEQWLDGGGRDQSILDLIEAYNRDDCVSTWKLRAWLEERRADEIAQGKDVPRPVRQEATAPDAVKESQARVLALVKRLTADLPTADEDRSPEQHATWLLAQLLDWHRREEKVAHWQRFELLRMSAEELTDSDSAVAGLVYAGPTSTEGGKPRFRYHFPSQEALNIRAGTKVSDAATGKAAGEVVAIDAVAGWLELVRPRNLPDPMLEAVIVAEVIPATAQKAALLRLGTWVADHGIDAPGPHRAERDLLLKRAPRVGQASGQPLVRAGESGRDAATRLARQLDGACLAIQGPPGTGKTYAGAHMIIELIRAGKRVGITANSHKVICNLLETVGRVATQEDLALGAVQKGTTDQRSSAAFVRAADDNADMARELIEGSTLIGAGTAWLWSSDKLAGSVDVLFVDEAGQMSLANVLALAQAADSIVLLGDPQQLDQPVQGSHPPGAEVSALGHLLGRNATIPPELGIFLERTWRMHPDLCRFTSLAFYDDLLTAEPDTARQRLEGTGPLTGTGLRWVSVKHTGNEKRSLEEADVVAELAADLIGASWVDADGNARRITWDDILIVAPYNAQVAAIADRIPRRDRVGTVDRFQGQGEAIAIYSMTTSSADLAPRGMEFLYSLNRLNVATSRARCLAVIVASPRLLEVDCHTPRQMLLANALCRAAEMAQIVEVAAPAQVDLPDLPDLSAGSG